MNNYKTYGNEQLTDGKNIDLTHIFAKLAAGDHDAFRQIFHYYAAQLLPRVLNIVKSKETAEEIIQETFLKLWTNKEAVSKMDNQAGWIFTVASNLSFNVLKKVAYEEKALARLKQASFSYTFDDSILSKEQQELLSKAIKELPPQRQIVFKLSREQGLTHQQIADQLKISPNTVKNQLVTALSFIKNYMQKAGALSLAIFFL